MYFSMKNILKNNFNYIFKDLSLVLIKIEWELI
jgi:hypothetical protein